MTFPSPEVAKAVGASKEFLDWMEAAAISDFERAWRECTNGTGMFKVLVTLNPGSIGLHQVAFRAAMRTAQAENMDLDEKLLDCLAQKKAFLEDNTVGYDHEGGVARAVALNRIISQDNSPRSKAQANLAVGWACCKTARSCAMALVAAEGYERFSLQEKSGLENPTITNFIVNEPSRQANDIRELFPLPLTMSKIRYPSRYERAWVI